MMRTRPGATPGTPPSSIPRPPSGFSRKYAPAWAAMRPAISLIGASSGKRRSSVSTVSYATAAIPDSASACVSGSSAAMWRYVKRTSPSRRSGYSGGIGSLTLSSSSDSAHTSSTDAICTPTRLYALSANALPTPAPASTTTSWPRRVSSSAPAGVSATRYSSGLISFATPIRTSAQPYALAERVRSVETCAGRSTSPGGDMQPLSRDEERALEAIAMTQRPDALPRVAVVEAERDRPERVVGPDDVELLGSRSVGGARDDAPGDQERDREHEDPAEHAF